MTEQSIQDRYFNLLKAYVARPDEKQLALAAELGRELVLKDTPPEEIAEIHGKAIRRLAQDSPDMALLDVVHFISAPLMEMLMAYGLAFRGRLEIRKREEVLAASKAYAESIIQNFLDTLIVVDREAKIQTVNPETCRLLGYTEEELIGQPVGMIFAEEEEEEEEVRRVFQFFRETGKSKALRPQDTIRNIELTYKTKDGQLITMSFNASVLTDEVGNVTGVVAGAKDLTEIKLAEEARRKSEERFWKVIENIFKFVPEGLLTFTNKLDLFRINKAFQDIVQKYSAKLNYTEQELTEIIIEQVKNRIINEDYTEIRIPKKRG